jgi:hypothetical protein
MTYVVRAVCPFSETRQKFQTSRRCEAISLVSGHSQIEQGAVLRPAAVAEHSDRTALKSDSLYHIVMGL